MPFENERLIERLVDEFEYLLVSPSLYDRDDLKQEISLIVTICEKRFDPAKGEFRKFVWKTVRNKLSKLFRDQHVSDGLKDVPAGESDNVYEYIPWESFDFKESFILEFYLKGYSLEAIAFGLDISKDSVKHIFREIVLKIQEANE